MLKGLSALVTGGASGLGRATVERLSRSGCRVLLCDLPASDGKKVAGSLQNVTFAPVDVTSEKDVKAAVDLCHSQFKKLDITVNCAGVAIAKRVLDLKKKEPHSLEEFKRVLQVNTVGTLNVVRLSAALMAHNNPDEEGSRGVVINTASIAAYDGQVGQVAYSASKGAITSMTLPLSRDLGPLGIRVVTIAPGLFLTPLMEKLPEAVKNMLVQYVPHPSRLGRPEEFAHLAEHIILNKMLNGCVIRLDGGLRMPA